MEMKESKVGKIAACSMILLIIIFLVGMGVATHRSDKKYANMQIERCHAYCNCSISNECNYVFDYNDVKDCECNGN